MMYNEIYSEFARSRLLPLHTRIVLGEPMSTNEMNSYDAAMFHNFHCNSSHVTTADLNEFLNKVSDIKNTHRMQT
jgi:hypothetical protein